MELFKGLKIHPDSKRILENFGILTPEDRIDSKLRSFHQHTSTSSTLFRSAPGPNLVNPTSRSPKPVGDTCGVHALLGSGETNNLEILDIPSGINNGFSFHLLQQIDGDKRSIQERLILRHTRNAWQVDNSGRKAFGLAIGSFQQMEGVEIM